TDGGRRSLVSSLVRACIAPAVRRGRPRSFHRPLDHRGISQSSASPADPLAQLKSKRSRKIHHYVHGIKWLQDHGGSLPHSLPVIKRVLGPNPLAKYFDEVILVLSVHQRP